MMVTVCEGEVERTLISYLRVSSILVACRGRFRSPLSNTVLIDNVRHRIEMGPGFYLLEQPIARTFGRAYLPMPQQGVVLCNQPIPDTILDEVLGGREHVLRWQIRCKEIEIVSVLSSCPTIRRMFRFSLTNPITDQTDPNAAVVVSGRMSANHIESPALVHAPVATDRKAVPDVVPLTLVLVHLLHRLHCRDALQPVVACRRPVRMMYDDVRDGTGEVFDPFRWQSTPKVSRHVGHRVCKTIDEG